ILVNTCGFIDAAKQESIDAMLSAASLKAQGDVKAVVAVGCLVQRYKEELQREIPEVDLFLGFSDLHHLVPALAQRGLIADPLAARGPKLPDLLEGLLAGTAVPWYRLLYVYSAGLTGRLVELVAREPRIVPYLDMPIQHASDRMLERMRRPERRQTLRDKVGWLRDTIPDLALRTTCLVGFPCETDRDFRQLVEFL